MSTPKRRYSDLFLLAVWVYAYGALVWVFRLLRRVEVDGEKLAPKLASGR